MLFQKPGTQQRPHRQESPLGGSPSPVIQCPLSHPSPRHLSGIKLQVLLLRSVQALLFSLRPTTSYPACHRTSHASPTAGPLSLPLPLLAMFFPRNGLLSLHFIFAQMSSLQRELPCPSLHDISHIRITFSKLTSFILAHSL